jgi:hypothetical protein
MDGITGWFVVDTHHEFYKMYPNDYSGFNCFGLLNERKRVKQVRRTYLLH